VEAVSTPPANEMICINDACKIMPVMTGKNTTDWGIAGMLLNLNSYTNSQKEPLMHKIEAQEISMRPKIYFTLQIAALVFVALATLVVSIIIFNFILFSIRINSHDSLLYFGSRGFEAFLSFFYAFSTS
jgi:hypothetical protein